MLPLLIREQEAMRVALADPLFTAAFTKALVQEIALQEPSPAYSMPEDEAQKYVRGILENRIRDARTFIELLQQPAFIHSAELMAAGPVPVTKQYRLPDSKQEEIIRRLVQPHDPAGAEPPIHVAASALGHRIVHQALANIFRPESGALRHPLAEALGRAWPEGTPEQFARVACTWLKARHDPAHAIADGLARAHLFTVKHSVVLKR